MTTFEESERLGCWKHHPTLNEKQSNEQGIMKTWKEKQSKDSVPCHELSKSCERVESGGSKSMVLKQKFMGKNRASNTSKRKQKHPKCIQKQSMHSQSPPRQNEWPLASTPINKPNTQEKCQKWELVKKEIRNKELTRIIPGMLLSSKKWVGFQQDSPLFLFFFCWNPSFLAPPLVFLSKVSRKKNAPPLILLLKNPLISAKPPVSRLASPPSYYPLSYFSISKHGLATTLMGNHAPCHVHAASLMRREGVPHLSRVLPAPPDGEKASFQCYKTP